MHGPDAGDRRDGAGGGGRARLRALGAEGRGARAPRPTRSRPTARTLLAANADRHGGGARRRASAARCSTGCCSTRRGSRGMVDGLRAIAAQPDPVGAGDGRMGPAVGAAHPPGADADRGDRGDLREPAERDRRRRRALPQGRQRRDPARRVGEPALVAGDPRRARRRARARPACRRRRSSWCRRPTGPRSARC